MLLAPFCRRFTQLLAVHASLSSHSALHFIFVCRFCLYFGYSLHFAVFICCWASFFYFLLHLFIVYAAFAFGCWHLVSWVGASGCQATFRHSPHTLCFSSPLAAAAGIIIWHYCIKLHSLPGRTSDVVSLRCQFTCHHFSLQVFFSSSTASGGTRLPPPPGRRRLRHSFLAWLQPLSPLQLIAFFYQIIWPIRRCCQQQRRRRLLTFAAASTIALRLLPTPPPALQHCLPSPYHRLVSSSGLAFALPASLLPAASPSLPVHQVY